jgi:hypothetical protein
VCELKGDVRVLHNATILHRHPLARRRSWKMKPHARKNDRHALARITEVTVASSNATDHPAPRCMANHTAPAVVFSAGGYAGNMFHDLTDVLVPLFITTRRFAGDVHLLVGDAPPWWLDRFRPLLRGISHHDVVDMSRGAGAGAGGRGVLCYPHVVLGLEFHKEMSVDAARTAGVYSMADFARLARRSYGLARDTAIRLRGSSDVGRRPRLLLISRKSTRAFTNTGAIARAVTELGYEVVVSEPSRQDAAGLASFARLVNSCDVLVGVHGAGLANLVFLPPGAVLVQVVPLGVPARPPRAEGPRGSEAGRVGGAPGGLPRRPERHARRPPVRRSLTTRDGAAPVDTDVVGRRAPHGHVREPSPVAAGVRSRTTAPSPAAVFNPSVTFQLIQILSTQYLAIF